MRRVTIEPLRAACKRVRPIAQANPCDLPQSTMPDTSSRHSIVIHGARQNNLRNLTLSIPLNELVVVTGVSGSGKSSLVFDTLYAEGQRRYVETFSPYARQFLDRMDKPQVDRIEGVPPAIAIDQTNPVRTSRSTVGTMTELNDHLKLLFARVAHLHCRGCGREVRRDDPATIAADMAMRAGRLEDPRLVLTFPVEIPPNFEEAEILQALAVQGYTRVHGRSGRRLDMIQDRFRLSNVEPARLGEALEAAIRVGNGRVDVHPLPDTDDATATGAPAPVPEPWRYSTALHCPDCDISYQEPVPSLFSFNSPLGACQECRGFGRVIGIDFALIVPDTAKTLADGAIKPWQTQSFRECQEDLEKYARKRGVPLDVPWRDMSPEHREWVLEGDADWVNWDKSWPGSWYGVRHFFAWLESKAYKMHIRVLLSRYRAYTPCESCGGARLQLPGLLWRVGNCAQAERVLPAARRHAPNGVRWSADTLAALPGLSIHDLMLLPIEKLKIFFDELHADIQGVRGSEAEAMDQLLVNIRARLGYLLEVGLGYLTLDRQSRTLSGGEVQRINLTTALGTSLVNTLFVLDEPSIGLHPRDMGRVIAVMTRLRDAGNSLVVVEHDPQIMHAADRILDIGPGPGERGGEIVFFGPPDRLAAVPESLTGAYLSGRRRADAGLSAVPTDSTTPHLSLLGVTEHNLKNVDVRFPLQRLVCLTGVSGSGKSTLIQDVLLPALLEAKGKSSGTPGSHRALVGHEQIRAVVSVDQSTIGKTTRSNPASYVGAFDAIRKHFASTGLARERGYTPGTFSFNSGNGRCPTCGGNGFEHVEMQFLSDVYLRCPDCDGKRYRAEVLEVTVNGKSMADVLEMTVSEAASFFADDPDVGLRLQPLVDVGLEYVRLGQPVPTLSGGESQRLKLAGHLADAAAGTSEPTLFLFDEPTTGLHFDDTARLLRALRKLLAQGHSLIVIEHNLDVIRAADWIIDLGPEGGDDGGELVVAGTVAEVMRCESSHTGAALREYDATVAPGRVFEPTVRYAALERAAPPNAIHVLRAREHNLKDVSVDIPHDKFTVVTGVSGSGKSTLAFDIVFAEGQRRYLESLNAYARQFVQPATRPDVDAIFGIPPTVAIEQRTSRGGRKSTVATLTELYHFLRLLYMKLGTQHCPNDGTPIEPQSPEAVLARILVEHRGTHVGVLAPLVVARKGFYTDLAKWARGKGYTHLRVDGEFIETARWPRLDRFKEHTIELPVADVLVQPENEAALRSALAQGFDHGKGVIHLLAPLDGLMEGRALVREQVFSTKRACPSCGDSFPELDPRLFSFNSKHGWCATCFGTGLALPGFDAEQTGEESTWGDVGEEGVVACPDCDGLRLNPVALGVRFRGRSIAQLTAESVDDVGHFFEDLPLEGRQLDIARDIVAELRSRIAFLRDVGLGYLSLDRSAPTLSGGEAQRIRLAAQLGSSLQGVCYILDEPTIGLHPRDNEILLNTLSRLQRNGNTLVVVEHDEDTIRRADHVVDLGPGAGTLGGVIVAQGTAAQLMAEPASVTGRYLRAPLLHPMFPRRPVASEDPCIEVIGADLHNLQSVSARVPLSRLTVVTGVSGSGKSTFARSVLHGNLVRMLSDGGKAIPVTTTIGCREIRGVERVGRVLEVDQTPIGKTPRSCPATYVGFWDSIRKLFAGTSEARMRGFDASRFSFNAGAGRCPTCEGQGVRKIEMSFLPDVKVLCETCEGRRFNPETLAVRFKDKSIGDVLQMSVDEAEGFFSAHRTVHHALRLLQDVGLGYLTLGQQSPTLSGGEAQRIKLVTELSKVRTDGLDAEPPGRGRETGRRHTLYVLDEPTVGLHMADVSRLITVLHRLVDAGNTVVVIEHNLDVMAEADWLIDLGPEGGKDGGRIVGQGSPEVVCSARADVSHTGRILGQFLQERAPVG